MSIASAPSFDPRFDLASWIKPLPLLAAAILAGHAPLAALHLQWLWQHEQYQYFPFVIAAVVGLLVTRWRLAEPAAPPRSSWLPWLLLAASVLLLSAAALLLSAWLAMVSLNVALGAVFLWIAQRRQVPNLLGIWCLLWLMVPPPLRVDQMLVTRLQALSTWISSMVLDAVGILHSNQGNILVLPSKELFVDEACSGIISVMSIVACSMIYAVWRNRSFVHLVILTAAGVFWAVVMNVARIVLIALAESLYQWDLTTGTPHEILSLAIFLVTFLALVSTDNLLEGLLAPVSAAEAEQRFGAGVTAAWNRWVAPTPGRRSVGPPATRGARLVGGVVRPWAAALGGAAFLALGLLQLVYNPSPDNPAAERALQAALAVNRDSLPARLGPWELDKFEAVEREVYSDFGRYSRSFTYRHVDRPGVIASVSLDFPYLGGWHDLCMCYRGAGWTTDERAIAAHDSWPFVEADLQQPEAADQEATVLFAGFDASGTAAEPPSAAVLFRPWFRLRRRLLIHYAAQLFQVQVFAAGAALEDESLRADLRELLDQARQEFRSQVAAGAAAPSS